MKLVTTRMMRLVKRMGPRKLKSFPFFAAQKVYAVRDPTTDSVNIKASRTILPSVIAQLTPTVKLKEIVKRERRMRLTGCFWW